jgi:hypothetical protein
MLLNLKIYEAGPNTSRVKAGGFAVERNDLPKWVLTAWVEFLFKTKNA